MFRHESLRPLSRQHHNGLALVVMATRGIQQRGARAVESWCARAVERYDAELAPHFDAEETVLFPALRDFVDPGLVDALVAEHRRLSELAARLRSAPDQEVLAEFLELLRSHIRREENDLFEQAQARMPEAGLAALAEPIREKVAEVCLDFGPEPS